MILYGDFIGWVPIKLQKAVEVQLIYRNSDDELETDRHLGRDGRRKKRRSGSLTSNNFEKVSVYDSENFVLYRMLLVSRNVRIPEKSNQQQRR